MGGREKPIIMFAMSISKDVMRSVILLERS